LSGEGCEFLGFGDADGERLFAEDVLAGQQGFFRHGKVLGVGRADVDGVDGGVAEDGVRARVRNGESGAEFLCGGGVRPAMAATFDVLHAAKGFEMDAAHESCAEDGGADALGHNFCLKAYAHHIGPGCSRMTSSLRKPRRLW